MARHTITKPKPKTGGGGGVLPKKPFIKGIPNLVTIGGGVAALGGVYIYGTMQKWWPDYMGQLFAGLGPAPPPTTTGPQFISINPTVVTPGTPVTLQGDLTGTPNQTYYTVFSSKTGALVTQGVFPPSAFMQPIQTTGLADGDYQVIVSDAPVSALPGGPVGGGGSPYATGVDPSLIVPALQQFNNQVGNPAFSPGYGSQTQSNLTFSKFARILTA